MNSTNQISARTRSAGLSNTRTRALRISFGLQIGILGALIVLQGASALFFLGDVTADFFAMGFDLHTTYESIATFALLCGVALGLFVMWRILGRARRTENALQMASGAFSELLRSRFRDWNLTPAEGEVALLTLKGFDAPEIAALRGTAGGTVRAQLARIYAKSGSTGRGQFVSLFIDALLEDPVAPS